MSMPLDTPPLAASAAPAVLHPTRPFYWSVRREVWESRSVYLAPTIVAGVILLGLLIGLGHSTSASVHWSGHNDFSIGRTSGARHPATVSPAFLAALPFEVVAGVIAVTGVIVGLFYCLGALFNERRDRSILFWKSLPVSNRVAVLAKAAVPMLVIPAVVFLVVTVAQFVTLIIFVVGLTLHQQDPSIMWSVQPFGEGSIALLYGLVVLTLWYAPIYAWLLLVSAWSKTMTFLWAVAPPLVLALFERIAFGTGYVGDLIRYRITGAAAAAFQPSAGTHYGFANIDLVGFLTTPGLWLGLIAAALMTAAVIWLRRRREPI